MKKKVAFLSRVSTMDQHSSIENQQKIFNQWLEKNSDCKFFKIYEDEGISGSKGYKRAGWLNLIEDGKRGLYDVVVAKSFSRFGRNQTETLQAIKELRAKNVRVVFLEDNLDSVEDMSKFGLFAWLAEQEAQKTSERIKMVWDSFNAQGKVHVCVAPYGYSYDKNRKNFIINEIEKPIVINIFNWYLEGYGFNKISQMLIDQNIYTKRGGKWAGSTIRSMLTNEFYIGVLVQGKSRTLDVTMKESRSIPEEEWYRHNGNHEAIISKNVFRKVNNQIKERSLRAKKSYTKGHSNIKRNSNKSLFSNLLICGECKSTMTIKRKKREKYKPYYQCLKYDRLSLKSGHVSNRIDESFLIETVKEELIDLTENNFEKLKNIQESKVISKNNKKIEKEILAINKKIEDQIKLVNSLLLLYTNGTITEQQFKLQNDNINKGLNNFIERREALEKDLKKEVNNTEKKLVFKGIEAIVNKPVEEWNNSELKEVIECITVYTNGTIDLKVKYFN